MDGDGVFINSQESRKLVDAGPAVGGPNIYKTIALTLVFRQDFGPFGIEYIQGNRRCFPFGVFLSDKAFFPIPLG